MFTSYPKPRQRLNEHNVLKQKALWLEKINWFFLDIKIFLHKYLQWLVAAGAWEWVPIHMPPLSQSARGHTLRLK